MMQFQSIGDLAGRMLLSQGRLKADRAITRHATELATGLTTEKGKTLGGDLHRLSHWSQTTQSAEVRQKTLSEAIARLQAKQFALETIGNSLLSLADDINLSVTTGSKTDQVKVSQRASEQLSQMSSLLNTQAAGHSIFAGARIGSAAAADGGAIYASVKSAVTGAITAQDVLDRVQIWMNDPVSGFAADAYLGSSDDAPPIRVDDARTINAPGRADDGAIRSALEAVILSALAEDEDLALTGDGAKSVLETAANRLRSAQNQLTYLGAEIGYAEAQAEQAKIQASFEISQTEKLQSQALAIDPYDSATRLQAAEQQLEKIYMLTARTSQMSLLEYLR